MAPARKRVNIYLPNQGKGRMMGVSGERDLRDGRGFPDLAARTNRAVSLEGMAEGYAGIKRR